MGLDRLQTFLNVRKSLYRRPLTVIEPCPAQLFIIQTETKWLNQVQLEPCIGAQANDVAGVGGDLRLVENNMQHNLKTWPDLMAVFRDFERFRILIGNYFKYNYNLLYKAVTYKIHLNFFLSMAGDGVLANDRGESI